MNIPHNWYSTRVARWFRLRYKQMSGHLDLLDNLDFILNCVPPADTAALFCLRFTNHARVISTIILFRCGRMAPTYSKRLGLKHATVHVRNTMVPVHVIHNTYECDREYVYLLINTIVGIKLF